MIPTVETTYRTAAGRGAFSSAVPGDFATRFKALLDDPAGTNAKLRVLFLACGKQDGAFARSQQLTRP